jgi:hypothetical protein
MFNVFFINGDARICCRLSKKIVLKEMVQPVVHNLKKYLIMLSALDKKFMEIFHEVVCNLHRINEPLVALNS